MEPRVTIEQFEATYRVPASLPHPDEVRWRLDRVVKQRFATSCAQVLEHLLARDDPSVWVVRSLQADLLFDSRNTDEDALAGAWGAQVAEAIARTVTSGASGDNVLYFPDRAAFLARFLLDVVRGHAWDRWYYRSFDTLRSLPPALAAAEALLREPQHALPALLQLKAAGNIEEFLRVLGAEAAKAYRACLDNALPETADVREPIDRLTSIWPDVALDLASADTPANRMRLLLATVSRFSATAVAVNLDMAIGCMLQIVDLVRGHGPGSAIVLALVSGRINDALQLSSFTGPCASALEHLAIAARGDDAWAANVVRTVAPSAAASSLVDSRPSHAQRSFVSPFASLFLLLPSLLELDLPGLAAPAPPSRNLAPEQVVRFLLGLKLAGSGRTAMALGDPALCLWAGLEDAPSGQACRDLGQSVGEETLRAWNHALCARLCSFGVASGLHLAIERFRPRREPGASGRRPSARARPRFASPERRSITVVPRTDFEVERGGVPLLLYRDLYRDGWLYAEQRPNGGALSGLRHVREMTGVKPELLFIPECMAQELSVPADPGQPVLVLRWLDENQRWEPLQVPQPRSSNNSAGETSEDGCAAFATFLSRARPAAEEWTYYSLPSEFAPAASLDNVLTLIAHAVLKGFARRLMGFEWSSGEYLYRNFLDGTGSVRCDPSAISVELPAVPIGVVLNLAGIDGQCFSVPWLHGMQVRLSLHNE